jgi:DNA-binding NarL/FixJ family response regulator
VWLGRRLTTPKVVVKRVHGAATPFVRDDERVAALGLTPREVEILEHIAAGLSNREIAERLFISQNTVKTHSSRVFAKLNARRRTEAVRIARREGVIA